MGGCAPLFLFGLARGCTHVPFSHAPSGCESHIDYSIAMLVVQRVAVEESRLGIPIIFGADVWHGMHTVFPIPLGTPTLRRAAPPPTTPSTHLQ